MPDINVPESQRALVFQGGGSLGAYEAGVFHVLYHWIKKDLRKDNENIFDIIAGTSIGAINASIILSHILEMKEEFEPKANSDGRSNSSMRYWESSPEKLIDFWRYVSSVFDYFRLWTPFLKSSWDIWRNIFPFLNLPSGEAFRRYLYTRKSLAFGEQYVFSPQFLFPFATPIFNKFFDYTSLASWYQYSNGPLRSSIEKYARKLSNGQIIKTDFNQNEPRLLLVSVNIKDAKTKTFDSYSTTEYQEGISLKNVIASAAVPKNFAYEEIDGDKFWDGGIISNSPIREVLSEHSKFWTEKLGYNSDSYSSPEKWTSYEKEKKWFENNDNGDLKKNNGKKSIPKLELCVVNLYPSEEEGEQIPTLFDYDLTKDRENDIRFHDKTEYDIKMANVVSDYKDFVEDMGQLAIAAIGEIKNRENIANDLKQSFIEILNKKQRTLTRDERPRFFYDLIRKRFDIVNVIGIQS